jgi:hypothetical protein
MNIGSANSLSFLMHTNGTLENESTSESTNETDTSGIVGQKSLIDYMSGSSNEGTNSYFTDRVTLSPEAVAILREQSPATLESLGYELPEDESSEESSETVEEA